MEGEEQGRIQRGREREREESVGQGREKREGRQGREGELAAGMPVSHANLLSSWSSRLIWAPVLVCRSCRLRARAFCRALSSCVRSIGSVEQRGAQRKGERGRNPE